MAFRSEDGPSGRALYCWYEGISFRAGGLLGGSTVLEVTVRSRKEHCERQKGCGKGIRPEGRSVPKEIRFQLEPEGECLQ